MGILVGTFLCMIHSTENRYSFDRLFYTYLVIKFRENLVVHLTNLCLLLLELQIY